MIITNNIGLFENSSCIKVFLNRETDVDHHHLALNLYDFDKVLAFNPQVKSNCVRYSTKKLTETKWLEFQKCMEKNKSKIFQEFDFNKISSNAVADKAVYKINSLIRIACNEVLTRSKPILGKAKTFYDSSELNKILVVARTHKSRWRKHISLKDISRAQYHYKMYRGNLDLWYKTKRKLSNENFRAHCNSEKIFRTWGIHKSCKNSSNTIAALPDLNGVYATDVEQHLNNILDNYIPESVHPSIEKFFGTYSDEIINLPHYNVEVNGTIISSIINSFSMHKAPGYEGFSPIIIKKAFGVIGGELVSLYRALIRLCYFPKLWKIGNIVLIPKPGVIEINPTKKSYRPITLLPVLGKILEKIIVTPIYNTVYLQPDFCKTQFGFTRQTSTIDALMEFDSFIRKTVYGNNRNTNKYVLAISLDIKGAFDNAPYLLILKNLIARKCPENLIRIVHSYFSKRRMMVNIGNIKKSCNALQGCPQGSVCGPSMWNILLDMMFFELNLVDGFRGIIKAQAYADDTIIYVECDDKNISCKLEIINKALKFISEWGNRNYLEFNASKTQAIIFNRKKDSSILWNKLSNLNMNNVNITLSKSVKYLGVIFDHKHNFNEHIKYVVDKAKKELVFLGVHCKNTYGSTPEVVQKLVNSVIYPKLTYGCVIWFECLQRKNNRKLIRNLNYLCDKKICHSYRTSSMVANAILASNLN